MASGGFDFAQPPLGCVSTECWLFIVDEQTNARKVTERSRSDLRQDFKEGFGYDRQKL